MGRRREDSLSPHPVGILSQRKRSRGVRKKEKIKRSEKEHMNSHNVEKGQDGFPITHVGNDRERRKAGIFVLAPDCSLFNLLSSFPIYSCHSRVFNYDKKWPTSKVGVVGIR
jgi:hypothetical protein